jgi:hypothetical protein
MTGCRAPVTCQIRLQIIALMILSDMDKPVVVFAVHKQ